jgi:hypothetical protein
MRRRWRVPVGALTIMCTLLALLFPLLSKYREAELIPSLVLAGVVGDFLLHRLTGAPGPVPVWRVRLFAGLMPPVLWSLFFICVAVFDGLGWHATLWVGVLVTSGALGYAMSLIIFQPYLGPAVERAPEAATPVAMAEPEGVTV